MNKFTSRRFEAFMPLAKRFGEEALRLRLRREQEAEEHRDSSIPKTESLAQRMLARSTVERCLITAMRISGLWGHARRTAAALTVRENVLVSAQVPCGLDGLRLLHLSDLHLDLQSGVEAALLKSLAGLDYDLVVFTGDYRDNFLAETKLWQEPFREIMSVLNKPAFGVLGNHDWTADVAALEEAGLRLLLNEHTAFEREGCRLHIAGVDDPQCFQTDDLGRAGKIRGDAATFRLLLAHGPALHREAAASFDLYLCGHTHGGQICLPGGIPLARNGRCPARMLRGSWRQGAMLGYTSVGVGCCRIPARLFCPPEITVHTLKRA